MKYNDNKRYNKMIKYLIVGAVFLATVVSKGMTVSARTINTANIETTLTSEDTFYEGKVTHGVNVRVNAGPSYDNVVHNGKAVTLSEGEIVVIRSEVMVGSKPWYEVQFLRDGEEVVGYSTSTYIEKTGVVITPSPVATPEVTITVTPTATPMPTKIVEPTKELEVIETPIPTEALEPEDLPEDLETKSGNIGTVIAIIMGIILLAGGGYVWYQRSNDKSKVNGLLNSKKDIKKDKKQDVKEDTKKQMDGNRKVTSKEEVILDKKKHHEENNHNVVQQVERLKKTTMNEPTSIQRKKRIEKTDEVVSKKDLKTESKTESKIDIKTELKTDLKAESKTELKTESKTDSKTESKTELKTDSTVDAKKMIEQVLSTTKLPAYPVRNTQPQVDETEFLEAFAKQTKDKEELKKMVANLKEHDIVIHRYFGRGEVYDNSDVKLIEIRFGLDTRFFNKDSLILKKMLAVTNERNI